MSTDRARHVAEVEGVVQGVGFRPFVARLAADLGLAGRVRNEGRVVRIEVEGERDSLARFACRLTADAPAAAHIERTRWSEAPVRDERDFVIETSVLEGERALTIPPDLATCGDCFDEVADPGARRHGYPFTSCTACGPRYTIVESLPYDRPRTTMAGFPMCGDCQREYDDPRDRRYHAQPLACPACGPHLRLLDAGGARLAERDGALAAAVEALRRGAVVAVKGLGGWQLACDARNDDAVRTLRERKRRPHQAFAVMVPDVQAARALARVDDAEAAALCTPAAPIVLLRSRDALAPSVAPDNARVGLMLPTTPLHHLLLRRFGGAVVCTSGNVHDEPIVTGDDEALRKLGTIADVFLGHDRPIARRVDDGVCHVVGGGVRTLRLGRGLGPLRLPIAGAAAPSLLCVGAHLKNAPAALADGDVTLWPHVGDLDDPTAREAFASSLDDLRRFLAFEPEAVVCDLHPDYASTRWAETSGLRRVAVQHHHAHVAACLAEHGVDEALGFAWDGVGLGQDGTAWGGEALRVGTGGCERVAWMRPFRLPGGDAAARDPRRALAGVLAASGVAPPRDLVPEAFLELAASPRFAPVTTSVGRLFDAVAALTGACTEQSFEGQAPIALERLAEPGAAPYSFRLEGPVIDSAPAVPELLADRGDAVRAASRFHATLVAALVTVAERERPPAVVLTGGCFQNPLLAGEVLAALEERGHRVLLPARVPPNDGGIAVGQAWVASRRAPG